MGCNCRFLIDNKCKLTGNTNPVRCDHYESIREMIRNGKYTPEDVFTNPEDPDLIIGEEYYFSDYLTDCLNKANDGGVTQKLIAIDRHSSSHAFMSEDGSEWTYCIRKK